MIWRIHNTEIVVPKLKDPRIFMIGVLITYTIVGHTLLAFDHHWTQIVTSLLVSCVLDTLVNYVKTKQIVLPVSGVITGLGLGLLIESIPLWPFIAAPILAIGSKLVIRFERRHIFNPSNFGLTILLLITPKTVSTIASQWGASLLMVAIIIVVGGFTSFRVSRWDLVLSFLLTFCVMALLESVIAQRDLPFAFGPIFGAAFQLFTLSMLTDPKTTPATRRMRIIFGATLAIVDGTLRLMDNPYSLFLALLFVSASVPLLRASTLVLKQRLPSLPAAQETALESLSVPTPAQYQ
jgi:Predicted NADH:ubiquinone oxidoreductase, subunit RnfD